MTPKDTLKATAISVLRRRASIRHGVLQVAAAAGRGLVLCYHTIDASPAPDATVPTIDPERFSGHMETLRSMGDIVPLDWLLQRRARHARPQFAVTFDDDDRAHVRTALPILQALGIPATFFLSGRSLHDLGSYWWTRVDASVKARGLEATCRAIGVHARTLKDLVRRCRGVASVAELPLTDPPPMLEAADIRSLSRAGMTIGFHTLRHPSLPRLTDRELASALVDGREALAQAAGARVDLFAYPYGSVDRRVADAVQAAGYRAAFGLGDRPFSGSSDRFCIPRWQPVAFPVSDFAGAAALHLSRRVNRFGRGGP